MSTDMNPVASYPTMYYWGEGGHYGPFDVQQDGEWAGWPDFGQVMRYFRKQMKPKLSARAFGVIYGKAVNADGSPIGERRILEMELENKVPVDITRRKTIARLLKIPPMLFGLAVLEQIRLEPQRPPAVATGQTRLVSVAVDTTKYQNNVRTFWQLHETGSALNALGQLEADIRDLESLEQQAQGDLRYHGQEILFGYQILATHIVRDQRQFSRAHYHANEAVRVARAMEDSDLIACALFTRGWTYLEGGQYGTMQQGVFQVQQDLLLAAIRDFEAAKSIFPVQDGKGGMHPQLLGRLTMYMNRAKAALAMSRGERVPAALLISMDDITDMIGIHNIDDLYTRVVITGTRSGLHQAAYRSNRSAVFMAAGLPGNALKELNALERLTEGAYRRDDTRQFAWLDILKANVYMGLKEFGTATDHARRALLSCQDINSVTNIAIITDIYGRLRNSSYKASGDVRELGEILRETSQMPPE